MSFVSANRTGNHLLSSLPGRDRENVLESCKTVELTLGDTLSEPNEPIRHVYFPITGYISLITPKGGAESLEVGLVGSEGMFGITLVLGIDVSPLKGLVQGNGTALRMGARQFREASAASPRFAKLLNTYLFVLVAQLAQTAACGRFHSLESRLARWILMTRDRAGKDDFWITHEFLAQMLGVRRAGVTEAAGLIQQRMSFAIGAGSCRSSIVARSRISPAPAMRLSTRLTPSTSAPTLPPTHKARVVPPAARSRTASAGFLPAFRPLDGNRKVGLDLLV